MATPTASAAGSFSIGGDLTVHRIGFGAMRLNGATGAPGPHEVRDAHAVLRRAVELGVTLIDTAPLYGASEDLIGDAFPTYPDDVVIATKVGITTTPGGAVYRGRPEQIREDCERSLRRLHLDTIALSQLHTIDPDVPLEESVGALGSLRDEGKVRHVGLSNIDADELRPAQRIVPIASVQNRFNLGDRESDDVVDICAAEGIAFLPWRPLGHDRLSASGRAALERAAIRLDATPHQIALTWLLGRSPSVCPIPGTSNGAHLEANVAAGGLDLTHEERLELDDAPTVS